MLAIAAVGLGFYRGWFTMSTDRGLDDNKVDVNLTIDPDKAREDAEGAVDTVVPDSLQSTDEATLETESTAAPADGSPETESSDRTPEDSDIQ